MMNQGSLFLFNFLRVPFLGQELRLKKKILTAVITFEYQSKVLEPYCFLNTSLYMPNNVLDLH
jgi:hypothetical protein